MSTWMRLILSTFNYSNVSENIKDIFDRYGFQIINSRRDKKIPSQKDSLFWEV